MNTFVSNGKAEKKFFHNNIVSVLYAWFGLFLRWLCEILFKIKNCTIKSKSLFSEHTFLLRALGEYVHVHVNMYILSAPDYIQLLAGITGSFVVFPVQSCSSVLNKFSYESSNNLFAGVEVKHLSSM